MLPKLSQPGSFSERLQVRLAYGVRETFVRRVDLDFAKTSHTQGLRTRTYTTQKPRLTQPPAMTHPSTLTHPPHPYSPKLDAGSTWQRVLM